jgi:hypothetical protein
MSSILCWYCMSTMQGLVAGVGKACPQPQVSFAQVCKTDLGFCQGSLHVVSLKTSTDSQVGCVQVALRACANSLTDIREVHFILSNARVYAAFKQAANGCVSRGKGSLVVSDDGASGIA